MFSESALYWRANLAASRGGGLRPTMGPLPFQQWWAFNGSLFRVPWRRHPNQQSLRTLVCWAMRAYRAAFRHCLHQSASLEKRMEKKDLIDKIDTRIDSLSKGLKTGFLLLLISIGLQNSQTYWEICWRMEIRSVSFETVVSDAEANQRTASVNKKRLVLRQLSFIHLGSQVEFG